MIPSHKFLFLISFLYYIAYYQAGQLYSNNIWNKISCEAVEADGEL